MFLVVSAMSNCNDQVHCGSGCDESGGWRRKASTWAKVWPQIKVQIKVGYCSIYFYVRIATHSSVQHCQNCYKPTVCCVCLLICLNPYPFIFVMSIMHLMAICVQNVHNYLFNGNFEHFLVWTFQGLSPALRAWYQHLALSGLFCLYYTPVYAYICLQSL